MRWVRMATALVLVSACADDAATTPPDDQGLAAAQCPGEAESWDVGFAEDAQGADSPERALDLHDDPSAALPGGEPVRVSGEGTSVTFAFVDDGSFSGRVSVRELDNGWLVEGAHVCR